MEPAPSVIEQHRALVHASYGAEGEAEVVHSTTRADDCNFPYTPGPMQFSFPSIHESRPSVRFNAPYAAYDKATPRHLVRAPTPYYARDAAEPEDPVTDTESSSGVTVHPGVQAGIDIMTDNAVDVFVRPAPLFGDFPHLGTQAQFSYSSSQSMYAFQDERGQPMPPDHFARRQDVPTGVRQPPLLPRVDVFTRPPAPPPIDQYVTRPTPPPPAAPPPTTADLIHAHAARTSLQSSHDTALPLTDRNVVHTTPLPPVALAPSEPVRAANTITTTYDRSTTTPVMHGYTTTTVTPTVHGPEAYTWPQPPPNRTTPPMSADSSSESSSSSGPPLLSGQRDPTAQRVRRRTTSRTPSCPSSSDALGLARQLADSIQNQLQQADARELGLQKDSQDRELRTVQALERQRDDARQFQMDARDREMRQLQDIRDNEQLAMDRELRLQKRQPRL